MEKPNQFTAEQYITVLTFTYPHEAYIIKGRLESEGIECFLKDELTVQVDNFYTNALGGVKLQVRESAHAQAMEILIEEGYLKEKDFQPSAFWKTMDSLTSPVPVLKNLPLELRAAFVLACAVLIGIGVVWIVTGT